MTTKEIREVIRAFILEGNALETVPYSGLNPLFENSKDGPTNNMVIIQDVNGKQTNYCDGNSDNLVDLIVSHSSKAEVENLRTQLEADFDGSCYQGLRFFVQTLEESYLGYINTTNIHASKLRLLVME